MKTYKLTFNYRSDREKGHWLELYRNSIAKDGGVILKEDNSWYCNDFNPDAIGGECEITFNSPVEPIWVAVNYGLY